MSNKELRISKYGIARAAQALAPRVALSFYIIKNDRTPFFDIQHSIFSIRYDNIFLGNTQNSEP
jgi:hypothetical protein